MPAEFKLPELGESIETIQVVKVLIAPGDQVEIDQPVLELETDKATVEVPSSIAGSVTHVHVKDGDEITVDQLVFTAEAAEAAPVAETPTEQVADDLVPAPPTEAPVSNPAEPDDAQVVESGEFRLPELGENIETIQVVSVFVKSGQAVAFDQPVMELETDKATVEVPSSVSGIVKDVAVGAGSEMRIGDLVFTYEGSASAPSASATPAPAETTPPEAQSATKPKAPGIASAAPEATSLPPSGARVPAAPSIRKFARELGIDINKVPGSGPHGRVSIDDVKQHAKQLIGGQAPARVAASLPDLPAFEQWGEIRREKMSVIRRKTAEHMALSWSQVPHVTIFESADITELEALRKRYTDKAEAAGGRLTTGAMIVKVAAQALSVFPKFNASVDPGSNEIVYKDYINVGVAVDTERGLMVPVIKDTNRKSMIEVAVELVQIADKARTGKVSVDDLSGGTFTVTNLGRTCGTFFTPIINYPEVAILGVGRMSKEQVPGGGERKMLPLSLSFDHRVIDGSDGVKFLAWVIEALGEPLLLSLEG